MFAGLPMLAIPVLIYNLFAFLGDPGGLRHSLPGRLNEPSGQIRMASGAAWSPTLSDLVLALAIFAVAIDLIRAASMHKDAASAHVWSGLLLAVCSIELLMLPDFATSTFALVTLMSLISSASGLLITALVGRTSLDQRFKSGR